jgi:hypothetical protein
MLAGNGGVRRLLILCVVSLVAAGCRDASMTASPDSLPELLITESPSPYRQVTAGAVTARLPDRWHPSTAGSIDDPTQGLVAGPSPNPWLGDRPPPEGFAAVWIDGTRVGVPSDYYYLAATGPALDMITGSSGCSATSRQVIANHRPEFASGRPGSPGDYVAQGIGTCSIRDRPSRWAYFVAAPGYGPVREVGIPSSGLYVVVALMPDTPQAPQVLGRLLKGTEFGGASVDDFIAAAAASPRLTV